MSIKNASVTGLLTLLFLVFASCAPDSGSADREEYVTVGVLFPLTGEFGVDGIRSLNGVIMARNEINGDGGILGKKIDVIALDDENDEARAVEQYGVLKSMGAVAIVGSIFSRVSIAIAEAAEKDGMPIISPTSSNPLLTEGRENVFRAIFTDEYQAKKTARFARENLGAKTALLINASDDYAHIIDIFSAKFADLGGNIIGSERCDANKNGFSRILEKYVYDPPDIIFSPLDYAPAAELANAARAAGLEKTSLIGTDAWDGIENLLHYGGDGAPDIYYPHPFSSEADDPDILAFMQMGYDMFAYPPDYNTVLAYASMQILAAAMRKAESVNAADIVRAMRENEVKTVIGRITFDANNNPSSDVYMARVKNGVPSIARRLSGSWEDEAR